MPDVKESVCVPTVQHAMPLLEPVLVLLAGGGKNATDRVRMAGMEKDAMLYATVIQAVSSETK